MNPRIALAAVLLTLAAPLAASATTFVVYAPGLDATTAAALAQEELGEADVRVAGPIADWIGVPDNMPMVVGATSVVRCDEDQRSKPMKGYLIGIENAMADMSYTDALRNIEVVAEKVPCLASNATQDDIYSLYFLAGVAKYFEDDRAGAEASFARAAAIAPGRDWPTDWPPTPQPTYLSALRSVTANPPASLTVEMDGTVIHNGIEHDGSPRMLAGGHLLFVESTNSGFWIEVPPRDALPEQGILLTTAGQLREGLMVGDEKYAPWIDAVAKAEEWDDVVLVSQDGAVRYKDGVFTPLGNTGKRLAARARRRAKANNQLAGPAIAGLVTVGIGAGLAGAGVGINMAAYNAGIPKAGSTLIPRADYESYVTQNKVGLGLSIAGGVTAATGAILTVIGVAAPPGTFAAAPWFVTDGQTTAFGITGRLP